MERRLQKKRILPDLSTIFILEKLTQIEWSISKKQNIERAYEKKNEDKDYFEYCFEFDTNPKSRFFRISFNRLSKNKRLPVVYVTIYQKNIKKMYVLASSFFTG